MTDSDLRYCDLPGGRACCEHIRRWGGDRQDRRRYLCARDDDGSGRHCFEVKLDEETERVVARKGCERGRR